MLVIVGMMTFGFRAVVLNLLEFMESHCFFSFLGEKLSFSNLLKTLDYDRGL